MKITNQSILVGTIVIIILVLLYIIYFIRDITKPKKIEKKLFSTENNYSGTDFHKGVVRDKKEKDYSWLKWLLITLFVLYLLYLRFEEKLGSLWN